METILLSEIERDTPALSNAHVPATLVGHESWRIASLFETLYRTTRFVLALAAACFVAIFLELHFEEIRYSLSLPSFCRLSGMEPYLYGTQCPSSLSKDPPLTSPYVKPDIPLLDGPPPKPIFWADFHRLYELQHNMIEQLVNASTFEGAIMLQFIVDDVDAKTTSLYQLRMDVLRRSPMKAWVLRQVLFTGEGLGEQLAALQRDLERSVERLIDANRRTSKAIENAIDKQPQSLLAQAFLSVLPRDRSTFEPTWTWKTEIETRWQFYQSLTLFSRILYKTLVELVGLLPRLETFGKDIDSLHHLLEERAVSTPSPASTSRTPFLTWSKITRSGKDALPDPRVDEKYEALKKTVLGRLKRVNQAAIVRVDSSLTTLRVLSDELENMRHKIAEPGRRIPHYVHLRHIYVDNAKLSGILEKLKRWRHARKQNTEQ